MKKRRILLSVLILICLLVLLPYSAFCQKLPQFGFSKKTEGPSYTQLALPATDEEIDKEIAQLKVRITDLRAQSAAGYDVVPAETGSLIATPEELSRVERVMSDMIVVLERHVALLNELREIRRTNKDRASEKTAWRGFAEKPPFPISYVDGLSDSVANQKIESETLEMRLTIAKNDLQKFTKDIKDSRKRLRIASEEAEKAAGKPDEIRKRWQEDMARLLCNYHEAGAAAAEASRLVLEETLRGRQEYIRFLQEKLRVAESVSPLTKEDFEQKLKDLSTLRRVMHRQLEKADKGYEETKKRLQSARESLSRAQSELTPAQPLTNSQRNRLDILQSSLDTEQIIFDTARVRVSGVSGMLMMVDLSQRIWEDRLWLTQEHNLSDITEKTDALKQAMVNIRLWKEFIDTRLSVFTGLLKRQEEKVTEPGRTESQRGMDRLVLNAYKERQEILLELAEHLSRVERLANRLDSEFNRRKEYPSPSARIRDSVETALSFFKKIWSAELYVAEEATIVEDKKIVKPVSVTIGKLFKALLILLIGTLIAQRLTRPVRWIVTKKLGRDENIAQQIGKVSFLVFFIGVLLFSLVSVNIPFEVFAFLGGALAIGIGFGAQNLINNFISGLILLFDRSIKVGDIVEVDNQGGKVISIGMRSSLIRRFDGVELLVPNSQFLQQKVTNWTLTERNIRYSISVGVSYGSPTREVSATILRAVEKHPSVLKNPAPMVLFEEFAESALTFTVYFWLELISTRDNRIAVSEIRHSISEALREAGIAIAFPQRDVHLDSVKPIEVKVLKTENPG